MSGTDPPAPFGGRDETEIEDLDDGHTAPTPSRPDGYGSSTAVTPAPPGTPVAPDPFARRPDEPPTRRTRSGPMTIAQRHSGAPQRDGATGRDGDQTRLGRGSRDPATVRERATPPPLPPLGARAGIHDQRDGLNMPRARLQPLDARTVSVRLGDIAAEAPDDVKPADEPLGPEPDLTGEQDHRQSRMVVFFGPKGGVGATTLACNVGGVLAGQDRGTVLVDLDLHLGAVPVSLGVRPQRDISELVQIAERDRKKGPLREPLDHHESGLYIAAQTRIEQLGAVTVKRLPRFFDALGQRFRYILVDGLRDFNDHAVASMDMAHLVVIVITQDVPAVRAGARALRIFRRLGYTNDRLLLVVNRYHRRAPVSLDDVNKALGMAPHAHVHNDFPLIEQALNSGKLVEAVQPRSRPARDLKRLAELVAGDVEKTRDLGEPGLLGRLLKR